MAGGVIQQRPNHVNPGILTGAFMIVVGVVGLVALIAGVIFNLCSALTGLATAYVMLFLMAGLITTLIAVLLARRNRRAGRLLS